VMQGIHTVVTLSNLLRPSSGAMASNHGRPEMALRMPVDGLINA
jgi:hypothetical protein